MHKTYILTIQRNIDRAIKILPLVPNSEITMGLDAKKEDDRSFISHFRSNMKLESSLSDGEVACTLGHKAILEKFLKTNDPYCVVLEDDVEAGPDFQDVEQDLPEIFDGIDKAIIFVLGGQEGYKNNKYIDWKSPFRRLKSGIAYDLTASSDFVFRTCCYGIDRYAAKQLVQFLQNNLILADDYSSIVNNTDVKLLLKRRGYYSHPIGGPSELESERTSRSRVTSSIFYRSVGVFLIFFYNSIARVEPSFYRWILQNILFEEE